MSCALPRDRLCAVLARLESPFDGERAAAGLLASQMIRRAGLTWPDVLAPMPAMRPKAEDWCATVSACRARQDRLTEWERAFLSELLTYRRRPSGKQLGILAGIAARARA